MFLLVGPASLSASWRRELRTIATAKANPKSRDRPRARSEKRADSTTRCRSGDSEPATWRDSPGIKGRTEAKTTISTMAAGRRIAVIAS